MSDLKLTKARVLEGIWEGVITSKTSGAPIPKIKVTHQETIIEGVTLSDHDDSDSWLLRVPVPVQLISDGVQTFLIQDEESGDILGSFALTSGEALGYDIQAEVALLREELDMLKRAFRRHCRDTM